MVLTRLADFPEAAPADQRWAVGFRDQDWLTDDIFDILRDHNPALCIHDMIDSHPHEITAEWAYLRLHGVDYGGSYSHQSLTAQAERIDRWIRRGLDVYAYFNNDAHGYAVGNALDSRRYLTKRQERE